LTRISFGSTFALPAEPDFVAQGANLPKLNAVDAINPAFSLTKLNLFQPFRWGYWVRIALLGLLTGEMSSGGGCNFNVPGGWNNRNHKDFVATAPHLPHVDPHVLLALLPIILLVVIMLGLLFMYVSSVFRFSLIEAVLNGQVCLRDSWSRWQKQGTRFFVFRLLFGLAFLFCLGIVVAVVLMLVGISTFKQAGSPSPAAILGIMFGFLLLFLVALPYLLVWVLAKDFAVPIMAIDGITFGEAWRRVWVMVRTETGSVAGYLGMKIVLSIAAGIIFGIISLIILVILLLPIGGVGVVAVFAAKAMGMGFSPLTITLIVAVAVVLVALLAFTFAFISAPVTVFFPSYALYFLAGRFPALHDRLYPSPPPAPPAPEPPPVPPAPQPPPDFLPT
jgi:hypothetical protein